MATIIDFLKNLFVREIVVEKEVVKWIVPPYIAVALKEVGQHEVAGVNNNARIVEYLSTVVKQDINDEIPWCSAFVNWCMKESGYPMTGIALARSWLVAGTESKAFVPFSVVVFKRGESSWQGHVAFALSKLDGYIYVLGGNQSDSVSVSHFKEADVLSYRTF